MTEQEAAAFCGRMNTLWAACNRAMQVTARAAQGDVTQREYPLSEFGTDIIAALIPAAQAVLDNDSGTYEPEPIVTTEVETRTEPVPYSTERVDNDTLPLGTEEVSQEGVDGIRTIIELVTYTDGVETGREVLSVAVTTAPVPEIIQVGTMEP